MLRNAQPSQRANSLSLLNQQYGQLSASEEDGGALPDLAPREVRIVAEVRKMLLKRFRVSKLFDRVIVIHV